VVRIICFLVLISVLPAAANAADLGRITGQVYFRERPSRSAPIIDVLAPGTEVNILKPAAAGWHFILYRGQRGFVHESYVKLEKHQEPPKEISLMRNRFVAFAGIILIAIGVTAMLSVVAPFLFKLGIVLIVCALWVLMLDLAFNLGALYSLISVTLGVLIVLLVLARKKKSRTISTDEYWHAIKKAA
jgi:lysylphosphatidylglycerol synthetase-like protein (DUF2156 family)